MADDLRHTTFPAGMDAVKVAVTAVPVLAAKLVPVP
jgi:hypothetical protein